MNQETILQNKIRIALSEHGIVLRLNSGRFWQGKRVYSQEYKQDVLINLRPVAGCPEGTSDLLFVGANKIAFVEIKTAKGIVKPEQKRFIEEIRKLGHRAGVVRSIEDSINLIEGEK